MAKQQALATLAAFSLVLQGCIPLLLADAASVGASGKSIGEHALSAAAGKDCRVFEGSARADRKICEEHGAPATEGDFKGVKSKSSPEDRTE
jgi:hypothetical protein